MIITFLPMISLTNKLKSDGKYILVTSFGWTEVFTERSHKQLHMVIAYIQIQNHILQFIFTRALAERNESLDTF